MKRSTLLRMTPEQLDGYARMLGFDVSGHETVEEKADAIEARRERVATIDVAGLSLTVPMKRLHDKSLIGDEQMDAIRVLVTDEDGTVDADGYLLVLNAINTSNELKNF